MLKVSGESFQKSLLQTIENINEMVSIVGNNLVRETDEQERNVNLEQND